MRVNHLLKMKAVNALCNASQAPHDLLGLAGLYN